MMFCAISEVFTQLSFFTQKTTIQNLTRWLIVSSKVSLYRKSGRAPVSIKILPKFLEWKVWLTLWSMFFQRFFSKEAFYSVAQPCFVNVHS